jgi:hypothetical protein
MCPLRSSLSVLLLWGMILAVPGSSPRAHESQFPRMLQLSVSPQRMTLGLGVNRHVGSRALALRARFDIDSDGVLDDTEQTELALWLDERGRTALRLVMDGDLLSPEVVERKLVLTEDDLRGDGDAFNLRSAAVLAIGLRSGPHRIELSDRPEGPRDLVPVRLDLPSGWTLSDVLAEGEATPLTRVAEHSWQGAFAGRGGTLSFTVEVPPRMPLATEEVDSSDGRGAQESLPQVGSASARSE